MEISLQVCQTLSYKISKSNNVKIEFYFVIFIFCQKRLNFILLNNILF